MPEEQLDSDNSDMAGLYQVNSRNPEEAQNQAYQPGRLPSSSSDTFDEESDGDDSDIRAPRWRGTLSTSSSDSPEVSDSDSESTSADSDVRKPQVDLSKVKVTSSIFSSVQNRYAELFYLYVICVLICDMIYPEIWKYTRSSS